MLDRFDTQILALWQDQGDLGPVEMAQRIHLSPSQCSRRMQALRKSGYVTHVRAVLDPDKVQIGIMAYILLTMKRHAPEAAQDFRRQVVDMEEVLECQSLTGAADILLKVATRDLASFNRLLTEKILAAPEVATAQSSIILDNVKSTTSLPLAFASGRSAGG
ncbi:MAG: Lrp/AsnC family transcriptional regulator [Chakrabartia sp.]